MTTYRHTEDMGEISGFGGGYEECCQDMLEAGVNWLQNHKDPDLKGHGFKGVTGIFIADSDDAKELEKALLVAAKGEATGAMHHTVMQRLFYISVHGWDDYCAKMREADDEEGE